MAGVESFSLLPTDTTIPQLEGIDDLVVDSLSDLPSDTLLNNSVKDVISLDQRTSDAIYQAVTSVTNAPATDPTIVNADVTTKVPDASTNSEDPTLPVKNDATSGNSTGDSTLPPALSELSTDVPSESTSFAPVAKRDATLYPAVTVSEVPSEGMDISLLHQRVEILQNTLKVLEGSFNDSECDIEERCIDLFTNLVEIEQGYGNLRNVMKDANQQVEILKIHLEQLRNLRKHIIHLKNYMPDELDENVFEPKKLTMDENETSELDVVSPVPKSWAHLHSPKREPPKPLVSVSSIAHITEEELCTVPKYMRGRYTTVNINKLVDSLNTVYKKKYETLSKSKKTLKQKDLDYYYDWKRTENREPKGSFFVTIQDLNTFGTMKMDKTCLNIVTILRHLRRIRETRHSNNMVHYIIM